MILIDLSFQQQLKCNTNSSSHRLFGNIIVDLINVLLGKILFCIIVSSVLLSCILQEYQWRLSGFVPNHSCEGSGQHLMPVPTFKYWPGRLENRVLIDVAVNCFPPALTSNWYSGQEQWPKFPLYPCCIPPWGSFWWWDKLKGWCCHVSIDGWKKKKKNPFYLTVGQEEVRTSRDLEVTNLVEVRMLICVIETRN